MALDTAVKRASAINVGSPWRGILPFPDGTIDQGDRQAVAFSYSGVLAAAPPAVILFWSQKYLEMKYLFSLLPDADKVPCSLLLELAVVAEAWSVQYRVSGSGLFWSGADANAFWSGDANLFWSAPTAGDQGWLAWPGRLDNATRQVYEFLVRISGGPTQGKITACKAKIDVPDVVENFGNVAIAAGGTRLAITKTYRAIKVVNLTLTSDGGTARTAEVMDYGTGGPPLTGGPLIKCFDSAHTAVAGHVNAVVIGY